MNFCVVNIAGISSFAHRGEIVNDTKFGLQNGKIRAPRKSAAKPKSNTRAHPHATSANTVLVSSTTMQKRSINRVVTVGDLCS